MERREKRAF